MYLFEYKNEAIGKIILICLYEKLEVKAKAMTKVPLELNNKMSKREKPQRYKDIIKEYIYNKI